MKIIKEFINECYSYRIGKTIHSKGNCIELQIYKDEEYTCGFRFSSNMNNDNFHFFLIYPEKSKHGYVNTINEAFDKLKILVKIPMEVEKEFTNIFILYKLNNFKKVF